MAGQTYVIMRNHSAVRPDELSLKMGTEVILVDPGQEGWSLIREANNPRNEGWIPSNLLVEKKERLAMNGFLKENYSWVRNFVVTLLIIVLLLYFRERISVSILRIKMY